MKHCHVLVVSSQLIFVEALTRLVKSAGAQVIAHAQDWQAALSLLKSRPVDAIIVDRTEANFNEVDTLLSLIDQQHVFKVIFFNAADNQMVVHHRRQVTYLTPDHLIEALRV